MQAKDIPDKDVLEYLAKFQGEWTSLWNGHFKGKEDDEHFGKKNWICKRCLLCDA